MAYYQKEIECMSREELKKHGISCEGKRAVQLKKSDYNKYDLFVAMDSMNIRNIGRIFGKDPENKVHKLMDYTDRKGDVADPWYSDRFDIAYRDIHDGCAGLLEKLACHIVPDTKEVEVENEFELLDDRFLERPALAISHASTVTERMAQLSKETLIKASDLVFNFSEEAFNEVCELENRVDHYEDKLGTYLVKLSNSYLNHRDSQVLSVLLHSIGDFERISDHATNIAFSIIEAEVEEDEDLH